MDRAMSHSDGSFRLPASRIRGRLCRTNQASHTAFRGFGGPQGMMVCNLWMDHVAKAVGIPLPALQQMNLYRAEGDVTHFGQELSECRLPRCWEEVSAMAGIETQRAEVDAFNATSRYLFLPCSCCVVHACVHDCTCMCVITVLEVLP